MLEFLKFILSDFWVFIGAFILLNGFAYFTTNFILRLWRNFLKYLMVRKHGWPPAHCDADGDFRPIKKTPKDLING